MNRPKLVSSTLKVTASEDLELHTELEPEHCKSIDELLHDQEKEENKQKENQEEQKEGTDQKTNQEKSDP